MMKGSALVAVALSVLAFADARSGGLRPGQKARNLQASTNYQEVYFSEMMAEDESVVILEAGPIKFTASCKTVTYDYDYYYSSSTFSSIPSSYNSSYSSSSGSYPSSYTTHSSSSSHYYPSSSCYNPCGSTTSSSGSFSYGYDDDYMTDDYTSTYMSDDYYSYDYSYTESIAALELTYTAMGADYLYGSPAYANYPNETVLVGGYEAGESRTQTVFAGRDGGYGDMSTLQSLSGYYVSINGDSTIGIHKEWTEYLPGGTENFPDGVECMMAGFITYVTPENS